MTSVYIRSRVRMHSLMQSIILMIMIDLELINRFTNFNSSIFMKVPHWIVYSFNDLQPNSKDFSNVNVESFLSLIWHWTELTLWHGINGIHENRDKINLLFIFIFLNVNDFTCCTPKCTKIPKSIEHEESPKRNGYIIINNRLNSNVYV